MIDKKLLSILVCPVCKGNLHYNKEVQELICRRDALAFPNKNDVPVMLKDEARGISLEEREQFS